MGRSNIAEVGKRFSSEYQPVNRDRPKGSLNARTIFRHYLEQQDPPTSEEKLQQILDAVYGKPIERGEEPKFVPGRFIRLVNADIKTDGHRPFPHI